MKKQTLTLVVAINCNREKLAQICATCYCWIEDYNKDEVTIATYDPANFYWLGAGMAPYIFSNHFTPTTINT